MYKSENLERLKKLAEELRGEDISCEQKDEVVCALKEIKSLLEATRINKKKIKLELDLLISKLT